MKKITIICSVILFLSAFLFISACGNNKNKTTTADSSATQDNSDKESVKIGNQEWMTHNLNVSVFRNGDRIPEAKTEEEWIKAGEDKQPAWCYYNNDKTNGTKYGKIYNWYAVNDFRGLAPQGWRIPAEEDWKALIAGLGGDEGAGAALKSSNEWNDEFSNNTSGFSALPGGIRFVNGTFSELGSMGSWWGLTEEGDEAWTQSLSSGGPDTYGTTMKKAGGNSVRCIKK